MFDRFTEDARQVVVLAQEEAQRLRHNYIGTEHVLLGLLRQRHALGGRVLEALDITLEGSRADVVRIVGHGQDEPTTDRIRQVPFTPRAKKVLELAMREALRLGHDYIGSEHILLALVRVEKGVAAHILFERAASARVVAARTLEMLASSDRMEYVQAYADRPGGLHSSLHVLGRDKRFSSLVAAWFLFVVSLGIGILVGWLIWG